MFITKINAEGTSTEYTLIIGGDDYQTPNGIAVSGEGIAYITGYTSSSDFPTTEGAYDTSFNSGSDCFITKLNPDGTELAFSTFLGDGDSSSNSMLVPVIFIIVAVIAGLILIILRKKGKKKEESHVE